LAPRGLCILFFSARGRNGEEIFHPSLSPRTGQYKQYHSGDINAFHVSYYRRRGDDVLDLCNLRKSHGFHLVATGADPIPTSEYAEPPYTLEVIKVKNEVRFRVHGLEVFQYVDDESHGPL